MESQNSKKADGIRKLTELQSQIALLQSHLLDIPDQPASDLPIKKTQLEQSILAPATPSPKKKRKVLHEGTFSDTKRSNALPLRRSGTLAETTRNKSVTRLSSTNTTSTFIAKLASLDPRTTNAQSVSDRLVRSIGFSDQPVTAQNSRSYDPRSDDVFGEDKGVKRDDRMAVIEDLAPGPYNHRPPFDDPNFDKYEPHSTIRLSSRNIPHDQFQDYLRGRYYLSPSTLYSVVRLLPSKQGYDVPVEGDWVTIAVVAERGPIKFTRAPIALGREEDEKDKRKGSAAKTKDKDKTLDTRSESHGKKYVNLKLIDFGCRTRSSSSHSGSQAMIRGDAFLSLLLFESDGFDTVTSDGAARGKKLYKGGSKGAFETMAKLKEGAVVALLNPKVLKPFQRSNDSPHPTDNILALTPESASSIAIIGYALDLGMCTVLKQDGKTCGKWVDKRTSDVCEWHVQTAVERRRAGRAEFSSGTSGMAMSATKRVASNPSRQWGLKPDENAGTGATYVMSGHVVSESAPNSISMYVAETIGREAQAKASRVSAKGADKVLKTLLERDRDGMRAVMKARKVESKDKDECTNNKETASLTAKAKDGVAAGDRSRSLQKNAYSADVVKKLGFDPTGRAGSRNNIDAKRKLEKLAIAHSSKPIELAPRPGKRRSCVSAPGGQENTHSASLPPPLLQADLLVQTDERVIDLESSDMD